MPSAPPAKTNITWTPTSVTEILSPGQNKTVSVSFSSTKNIARVSVQVSQKLQSLVQVQPQVLDRIRKNEQRTITLMLAPTSTAPLGTATGTIQLKKEKKDSNDKDEGDEDAGKLLMQPLGVTVNVWQAYTSPAGFTVKLPPSFTATINPETGRFRAQNFTASEGETLQPGEILIEIFRSSPDQLGNYASYVSISEQFQVNGGTVIRGNRAEAFLSNSLGTTNI